MKKDLNIVVLDGHTANPGDLSWDGLGLLGNVCVYPRTSPAQVLERAADADVILTNKVVLDAALLQQLDRVRYIGVLATGYNVVDLDAATPRGIVVTNIPAYSTESVVQMTFAHILNITNQIGHYAALNRNGKWASQPDFCYWDTPLAELAGKKLGIVGLGNIGMRVAQIAMAFGMEVWAVTRKEPQQLHQGIRKATLDEVLGTCDILTLHCPLTESTHHLIDRQRLGKMKHGAILINTGRGPLVDEQAVMEALDSGRLSAYGADVLAVEPPAANHPLVGHPRSFITPHIAWATPEARGRLVGIAIENVKAFVAGKPQNVVNNI